MNLVYNDPRVLENTNEITIMTKYANLGSVHEVKVITKPQDYVIG